MSDQEYGAFTPQECQRIWKAVMSYERNNKPFPIDVEKEQGLPIYFKNDSGHVIPSYSILQVKDLFVQSEKDYVRVVRPIDWTGVMVGPFLFSRSGEIPVNGYGVAQAGPIYRVKYNGTAPLTNTRIGPVDNQWYVDKGSMFTVLGVDTIESNLVRVIANHTPILGITNEVIPGNGIGDVTKKDPADGDWVAGSTVYEARNPSTTSIASGALVLLFPVDAKWAAVAIC